VAVLKFPDGMLAHLAAGVSVNMDNILRVWGDAGHIVVPGPWVTNRGTAGDSVLLVHREGQAVEEITVHADRNAYSIEADTVADSIGDREAVAMPWADTLGNMRTLDRWRAEIGLAYEASGEPGGG